MLTIEGGCLCGAVRYSSDAEPLMQVVCHCETCRKNSGSAFSMNVAVPQDSLRIERGSPRRYEDHSGASGKAFYRFFCGDCGSHVYSHGAAYGAIVFIKAGTLDDANWLAPNLHIWCAGKLPRVGIPGGRHRSTREPGLSRTAISPIEPAKPINASSSPSAISPRHRARVSARALWSANGIFGKRAEHVNGVILPYVWSRMRILLME